MEGEGIMMEGGQRDKGREAWFCFGVSSCIQSSPMMISGTEREERLCVVVSWEGQSVSGSYCYDLFPWFISP